MSRVMPAAAWPSWFGTALMLAARRNHRRVWPANRPLQVPIRLTTHGQGLPPRRAAVVILPETGSVVATQLIEPSSRARVSPAPAPPVVGLDAHILAATRQRHLR